MRREDVGEICGGVGGEDFGVRVVREGLVEYAGKDARMFEREN